MFGLPTVIVSIICYSLCCMEAIDDGPVDSDEEDDEDGEDEGHLYDGPPPPPALSRSGPPPTYCKWTGRITHLTCLRCNFLCIIFYLYFSFLRLSSILLHHVFLRLFLLLVVDLLFLLCPRPRSFSSISSTSSSSSFLSSSSLSSSCFSCSFNTIVKHQLVSSEITAHRRLGL